MIIVFELLLMLRGSFGFGSKAGLLIPRLMVQSVASSVHISLQLQQSQGNYLHIIEFFKRLKKKEKKMPFLNAVYLPGSLVSMMVLECFIGTI